ncbi:MAG: DNA helicase RecQ [Oscillospiraceae bacterium]|nr:DNA helicase RecQ [Oscillospiraceae bacterium]
MEKQALLQHYFGYGEFRPGQEELVDGILNGQDVFGIMPTGGGKSICYQLPGLILPGVTLVVSPLISLMHDQVMALKAAGIPGAYVNSSLTFPQLRAVYRNMLLGKYKIIYVAPERLQSDGFLEAVEQMNISMVAVDEAHCISQWGQDFRPSYLKIVDFIRLLPRRPVIAAFTATATQKVREDVKRILDLRSPVEVVTGFDRPNLWFEVRHPELKDGELLRLLEARKRRSGIVYCATRKSVEQVCQLLTDRGYAATRYHAGLEERERMENQNAFLYDEKTVMVATNAFGMGIDKSNVNFVIHYNMPKSLEAYYQEAGRAGRDGSNADCILLYAPRDVQTARFFIENGSDNEDLTEEQREVIKKQDYERLEAMVTYCKTRTCLRGWILEYFGQKHPEVCGNCGSCAKEHEKKDITKEAQMILSCVRRIRDHLGYYVGKPTVVRTLQGSREKKTIELGLNEISTYGLMKTMSANAIKELISRLEDGGYLVTELEHQTLRLTEKASGVLYLGESVEVLVLKQEEKLQRLDDDGMTEDERELFDLLRECRSRLARANGVAPFMIFSNATLMDMARKHPTNMTAFKRVSGVGEMKASWYGKEFLKILKKTVDK